MVTGFCENRSTSRELSPTFSDPTFWPTYGAGDREADLGLGHACCGGLVGVDGHGQLLTAGRQVRGDRGEHVERLHRVDDLLVRGLQLGRVVAGDVHDDVGRRLAHDHLCRPDPGEGCELGRAGSRRRPCPCSWGRARRRSWRGWCPTGPSRGALSCRRCSSSRSARRLSEAIAASILAAAASVCWSDAPAGRSAVMVTLTCPASPMKSVLRLGARARVPAKMATARARVRPRWDRAQRSAGRYARCSQVGAPCSSSWIAWSAVTP